MKSERELLLMICNKLGIDPEEYEPECAHNWEEDTAMQRESEGIPMVCTKCGSNKMLRCVSI